MKIGWFLLGNYKVGSSRIHGINIHKYFMKMNINSIVIQSNVEISPDVQIPFWKKHLILRQNFDIFIFQKVFKEKAISFAKRAKKRSIKTIFLQSDLIYSDMAEVCDKVIVTSNYLKNVYDKKYGINSVVIEDAVEVDSGLEKQHRDQKKLKIVWVGHSDNWETIKIIYDALEKADYKYFRLVTISNHPDADIEWDIKTVQQEIMRCDIAVIPSISNEWSKAKSNNRLTMFMALGLPVIASPVPAYEKIVKNFKNGFLANNVDDWVKYLSFLKSRLNRQFIAENAKKSVKESYDIDIIGKKWINVLSNFKENLFKK